MGGRKKTGKKEKKLRTYAIPKVFDCENCSSDQTLHINISKKQNTKVAKIYCIKCKYSTKYEKIGALDSAIDIYNKWCEDIQNNNDKNSDENDNIDDVLDDEENDPGETL
ncbi:Elf1-like transcription elongation factor (macronuclear) [Tetrahymena thermophila SB210]|uniref:Transcription elongation factor 1 homolog n=1 Tax=Tetrahymena thermophila (strain SB210) TaxID=312017 RepID=Q22CJ9_TETTS|nr:Elf1-like transcription elongation factor [Tetrahymena thermophila SB210]EAR82993.1 Elf1-like transcription elongation factor [Tetrahymena thermophila SB210]|eukprot:XP_001030656.1 Elf1-like transcription elongation factor [Tetrahymena thermophila SB210]